MWEWSGDRALDGLVAAGVHILRRGELSKFTFDGAVQDLIDALVVDSVRGSEDQQDWTDATEVDEWVRDDYDIADYFGDLPVLTRWVYVEAADVTGRLVGLVETGCEPGAIVVDVAGAAVESGRDLAEFSWFIEGGDAPMSGGGRSRLADIGHGWLMYDKGGDQDVETQVWPNANNPVRITEGIKQLIVDAEAFVPAAFALEPLDPEQTLSADERSRWSDLLREAPAGLIVACSENVQEILRAELSRESPLYVATRDAIREPSSLLGHRLLASLADAVERENPLPLMFGAWLTGD